MIGLFRSGSELTFADAINAQKDRLALLCSPNIISSLYYERRDDPHAARIECPIIPLDGEALANRDYFERQTADRVVIVADDERERERVSEFQARYPDMRFVGLAEFAVPALLARKFHLVFERADPPRPEVLNLAILFATPRSGSSFVADTMTDMGVAETREHLRPRLIEALRSRYVFDESVFWETFLDMAQSDGWVGTKIITHFLETYIAQQFRVGVFEQLLQRRDIRIWPIFLDRDDRVLQTVSGALASKRGVWHITDDASHAKVRQKEEVGYNFNSAFVRYVNYEMQQRFLQMLESLFTSHKTLRLNYETDVEHPGRLRAKLGEFLGFDVSRTRFALSSARKRIASGENTRHAKAFRNDMERYFGA